MLLHGNLLETVVGGEVGEGWMIDDKCLAMSLCGHLLDILVGGVDYPAHTVETMTEIHRVAHVNPLHGIIYVVSHDYRISCRHPRVGVVVDIRVYPLGGIDHRDMWRISSETWHPRALKTKISHLNI